MSYAIEYEIKHRLGYTFDAMLNRDDAVPDLVEKWDKELGRCRTSGLSVDRYMQELRREFATLTIRQRFWCRAYGELLSYDCGLGKYAQNWVSVTLDLQPNTAEYRQSEIGTLVNRVLDEAERYWCRWGDEFDDDLETLSER